MQLNPDQITSRDNPRFKSWVQLLSARGLKRKGEALVSGRKIVPELMGAAYAQTLILADAMPAPDGAPEGLAVARVADELFAVLDTLGTGAPLLAVKTPDLPAWDAQLGQGLTVAIAAQDPVNLGSVLRSAAAFGAARAVLLKECAHPFLPRVTRAASGANFKLPLLLGPAIADMADLAVALDMEGPPLAEADLAPDMVLLLGEEGAGVPDSFTGRRLSIPISDTVESLNVAVAAGIALAEYRRRFPL